MPATPTRKDAHRTPDGSPASSLKSSPSISSLKSKRVALPSPGKLVKKVKSSLRRISDHVTHHGDKQRASGLAAIVPLTTSPFLAPVGMHASEYDSAATTPLAQQQQPHGDGAERTTDITRTSSGGGIKGPWEERSDSGKQPVRRSRSLSLASAFFPRTRTSSRSESASTTTVEHSISDSGTLACEGLAQELQGATEEKEKGKEKETSSLDQVELVFDPSQHQLVVVEEITPEEEQVPEEPMNRDQSSPLEPPATVNEEVGKEEVEMVEDSFPPESTPSHELIAEPVVPDPFLIDEEGDTQSEEERKVAKAPEETVSDSQGTSTPAHEISLLPQDTSAAVTPSISPSPRVDKDVPPLPSTESEKEETPELFVPALIAPSLFLPIPNTDPLTTLLSKYIYPQEKRPVRDLTGEWQRTDFHTLVMTNSWRALARMARDRLVTTNPEDLQMILNLWYIRLSSLARLRLFNQTSAECTNIFAVLNAIEPADARAWLFDNLLPFELEVMHARLKYWAGDHMGYLDVLYALFHKCKLKVRQAKREAAALAISRGGAGISSKVPGGSMVAAAMWKERAARISLIIASQLMEMNDLAAATKLMEPLCEQPNEAVTMDGSTQQDMPNTSIPALRSAVGRMYLQGGNLHMAARHFSEVAKDPAAEPTMKDMNAALFACADGQWERATATLRLLLEKDAENYVAVNNMAVALLGQGKVQEGITMLENALKTSPSSVVVAEPFLFNLSTLYELRFANAIDKKRELLVEVAKWSGDGLKTSCLKMPAN
ncbi:hypothetical protein AX15_003096 [Amanita polypyramis BW_CC]|nr:hypothetical protein AX15_003096 [Amanita polypyramis BW_CC]